MSSQRPANSQRPAWARNAAGEPGSSSAGEVTRPEPLHLVALLSAGTLAGLGTLLPGKLFEVVDGEWYLQIARGTGLENVLQPFASRQLGPLVVRGLSSLLHLSLESAFVLEGVLALLVLLVFVFGSALPERTPWWLVAAMVAVPFWPRLFHDLVLPDLWYAALLAVLLFLLAKRRYFAAACMMLPLMLSRESTSLTLLCFLLAGFREFRWGTRIMSVAAAGGGAWLAARLSAASPGNSERLPSALYMLLKVPWNATRLLGVDPWSNRYQYLCKVPRWRFGLHLGSVSAVGVCRVGSGNALQALAAMTLTFGLLPLLALWLWLPSRRGKAGGERRCVLLRFALLYGGASFVLAPLIGVSYARLFGYAWPLVFVALPLLAAEPRNRERLRRTGTRWYWVIAVQVLSLVLGTLEPRGGAAWGALLWLASAFLLWRRKTAPEPAQA